jgi:sulfur-oxidizing protein SoxX
VSIVAALSAIAVTFGCASRSDIDAAARGEQMVKTAYPGMPETLTRRAVQDDDQRACSRSASDKLASTQADQLVCSAKAAIKYPSSGQLVGEWKVGERLVTSGAVMRVRDGQVERVKENGAFCVNCYALDPTDVNVGNLGPPLTGYALQRGRSDAVIKYTYEKIYNSWAFYPCSTMPRFGHNAYLTPDQIAHVVTYLVDSQSPVNRK